MLSMMWDSYQAYESYLFSKDTKAHIFLTMLKIFTRLVLAMGKSQNIVKRPDQ